MREYEFGTRIFIFRSIQYYFLYHCKEFIFDNVTPNIFCLVHRNSWNSLLHSQTDSAKVLAINIFLVMTDRETSGISGSICTFFFFFQPWRYTDERRERERKKMSLCWTRWEEQSWWVGENNTSGGQNTVVIHSCLQPATPHTPPFLPSFLLSSYLPSPSPLILP